MKKKKKRKKRIMVVVLQERELSTEKMVRDAWCCEYSYTDKIDPSPVDKVKPYCY